ncbi:MAG: XylR family transcriptional regulator, partial [Limosilactobacillus fermentum]
YGPQTLYFSSPLFDELPELYQQVRDWLVKRGLKINIKMIAGSEMSSLLGAGSLAIRTALGLQKYRLVMQWPKKVTNVD